MTGRYHHLKGVERDDIYMKRDLPVHLILGASEYAHVKTETTSKIVKPWEPIAEWTRLGCIILPPGSQPNLTNILLIQTSAADYENLCRLDVLGLQDHSVDNQLLVYEEFKEQPWETEKDGMTPAYSGRATIHLFPTISQKVWDDWRTS